MLKIQDELRETTLAGAHPASVAPHIFGQLHTVMQERVAAVARGEPITVEVRESGNKYM